jgi:hypothetical protein
MGYTHYWSIKEKLVIPARAQEIIQEILAEAYTAGIVQYEHDDRREPVVTDTLVRFNGVEENGHETFYFDITDTYTSSDGQHFAFCKTAQKPYDVVVMKVLIVLKCFLDTAVVISSDGSFQKEWEEIREYMHTTYNIRTYVHETLEVSQY